MDEFVIKDEVKKLPETPGVYLMHNEVDEVIYVGKAINLKARVSQYFHKNADRQNRIQRMIANIRWFEVIQVETELEALILESNLIKEYRPRYNAALRSDENHPYLKIDLKEDYPGISVTTENILDNNTLYKDILYMGPYYKSMDPESALSFVNKYFRLRSCHKSLSAGRTEGHVCLYHSMGQCMGPCQGQVDMEEYRRQLSDAIYFLKTQDAGKIRADLTDRMKDAAETMDFECAARYKHMLKSLEEIVQRMTFRRGEDSNDSDLFAIAREDDKVLVLLYLLRNGRLSGRDLFHFRLGEKKDVSLTKQEMSDHCQTERGCSHSKLSDSQILQEFIRHFYRGAPYIPKTVILTERVPEKRRLEDMLSSQKGRTVTVSCPRAGEKGRFVEMTREHGMRLLKQIYPDTM